MADWLEIANTLINLKTMERVGDVSRAQQQMANHMLATEATKEKDNALLSQLVDVVVKVRQSLQDSDHFNALLSAGMGLLAFKEAYPTITDAEMKLRASDIQLKLVEMVRATISDPSMRRSFQSSLTRYLSTTKSLLQQNLSVVKGSVPRLVWLDTSKELTLHVGEELICLTDIPDYTFLNDFHKLPQREKASLMTSGTCKIKDLNRLGLADGLAFRQGSSYKIVDVNPRGYEVLEGTFIKGFLLENESGKKALIRVGKDADFGAFGYFDPPLPSLQKDISGWKLCNRLFGNEFLSQNLDCVRTEMLASYQEALAEAGVSTQQIADWATEQENFIYAAAPLCWQSVSPNIERLQQSQALRKRQKQLGCIAIGVLSFCLFLFLFSVAFKACFGEESISQAVCPPLLVPHADYAFVQVR